jgi:hypothetical protein
MFKSCGLHFHSADGDSGRYLIGFVILHYGLGLLAGFVEKLSSPIVL